MCEELLRCINSDVSADSSWMSVSVCVCVNTCVLGIFIRCMESRVGHNRVYTRTVYDRISGDFLAKNTVFTPYMTVYLVISLPKTPYLHRI
jgi:hypothetical protein